MRRLASIALLCAFAGIGTGAFDHFHQLQHLRLAAMQAAAMKAIPAESRRPMPLPVRDEADCLLCIVLHLPLLLQAGIAFVVGVGLLIALIQCNPLPLLAARIPLFIDCRGPPAL